VSAGHSFPAAWDPRVAALADFVEAERGLRFEHPVHVDFLERDDFVALVTSDEANLSPHDRDDRARESASYRALGLLEGDVDLFEAGNTAAGEAFVAYYDFASERIRVRGTELTLAVQGTLVHELTHALQDQTFDLTRGGTFDVDGQNKTFQAVVEGDAVRMERAWVDSLSDDDRADYHDARHLAAEKIDLSEVPEVLTSFLRAPYQFGPLFVELLLEADGQEALDTAFESPPAADALILDPFRYLAGDDLVDVEVPKLARDEIESEKGSFGAMSLFLMLAQRVPPHLALAATDRWAGDAYVNFQRAGRQCVRAAFAGRDAAETEVIAGVLDAWEDKMPERAAAVERHDGLVEVTSCDPGIKARSRGLNRLRVAVAVPLTRTQFALGALATGTTAAVARCAARQFVAALSPTQLEASFSFSEPDDAVVAAARAAATGCNDRQTV
jgi:hypothetical protein